MPRPAIPLKRDPPKRTLTKRQAVRHLIHAAIRLSAAREDPFAIHLLIQSADKILIDLSKRLGQPLAFDWAELIRPEKRTEALTIIREVSNFLKHADKDHDQSLPVMEIVRTNFLQLAICTSNYHALFGEITDHMRLISVPAKLISPDPLVPDSERATFDDAYPEVMQMTLAQFFDTDLWTDPHFNTAFPNLMMERHEDLQDTVETYNTRIGALRIKKRAHVK